MRDVSNAYKLAVYNRGEYELYARHFLPDAHLKIVDTAAIDTCDYSVNDSSFYSRIEELNKDVTETTRLWGTLEDFQFLLNGQAVLMQSKEAVQEHAAQQGWVTECMSDGTGIFSDPPQLTCRYPIQITTLCRTLIFNNLYDSIPKDFTLQYYRNGRLIATEEVTNNDQVLFQSTLSVTKYDLLLITIHSTTHPYRRVHLLAELPGALIHYADDDIVSVALNQQVDVFSESLIDGEIELAVQNVTKQLDILNSEGLEQFLQRRQPFSVSLNLVFPDDSTETVLLGNWDLASWKSNKGALDATFYITDPINRLAGSQYIKGTLPVGIKSLYDYAVDVFTDAGFMNYSIDLALHNIYSKACLPIAEHKELLRMIAQAGQAVVAPTADGGIIIKSLSPLIYASNTVTNGAFNAVDDVIEGWELTGCISSQDYLYVGTNSIKMTADEASVNQQVTLTADHVYYCRIACLCTTDLMALSGEAGIYIADILHTVNVRTANLVPEEWQLISGRTTGFTGEIDIAFKSTLPADVLYIDGMLLLDLTVVYGAGKEPTQEWCDKNIPFVDIAKAIPRAQDPTPIDALDYHVLIDAPEVELSEPVKSIETNIYSYIADADVSEVYKGSRVAAGTETFDIKYSSLAKDVTIVIYKLDDQGEVVEDITETALIASAVYNRAATLTVRAVGTIQVVATGVRLTTGKVTYKITSELDHRLLSDAVEKTIDNELITYAAVAEDVTAYAAYWYNKRYHFSFDWRQNPAIELLDTVTVHDDFSNDKGVMLTERDIEYADGFLRGSSKGVV